MWTGKIADWQVVVNLQNNGEAEWNRDQVGQRIEENERATSRIWEQSRLKDRVDHQLLLEQMLIWWECIRQAIERALHKKIIVTRETQLNIGY